MQYITDMNSNIFEIISQLVRRLLYDGEIIKDEEGLIASLREDGYKLDEINRAFEFIFSSSQTINSSEKESKKDKIKSKVFTQRVLDFRERTKFNIEAKGILIKLKVLSLIKEDELEKIIARSLLEYTKAIDVRKLWKILEEEIDNEMRLLTIGIEIEEFKDIIAIGTKYFN